MVGEEHRGTNAGAAFVPAENNCGTKKLANSTSTAAAVGVEAVSQRLKLEPPGDGHESTTCADDSVNDGCSLPTTDSAESSPQMPSGMEGLFDQLDSNGDGVINRSEFAAGCVAGLAPNATEVALRNRIRREGCGPGQGATPLSRIRREGCGPGPGGTPLSRQRGMGNLTPTPRTPSAGAHHAERLQRGQRGMGNLTPTPATSSAGAHHAEHLHRGKLVQLKPWKPPSSRPQVTTPTGGRRCSSLPELASSPGKHASVHPPALRALAACGPPARQHTVRTGLPPQSFATPQRAAPRQQQPPPARSAGAALHALSRQRSGMGSLQNAGARLINQRAQSVFVL